MKRQHIWIKAVFERIQRNRQGDRSISHQSIINSENDKLMADYRTRFNELVTLSKNITRFSPSAAFTYLTTDIAGTGIIEQNRLKEAVLRYKDFFWDKPTDSDGNIIGDFPTFSFKQSSVKEILMAEGLMNFAVIILFNVLAFTAAYVAFLRYDVR